MKLLHILLFGGALLLDAQPVLRFTYIATWGEQGSGPGQFKFPGGFDAGPAGNLYIADTGNQRIEKFDSRGRFVTEIGGFGWGAEQFDGPVAVDAGNGLDVFVADYNNDRIQRYDKDLHYLASFRAAEHWPEHLMFGFPLDVALSDQGELFCLDGENFRILKMDVLGSPQRSFGDFDSGAGRLEDPRSLFIGLGHRVWISDAGSHELVVFDVHGNFLFRIGRSLFQSPRGMAEIPGGILISADAELGVLALSAEGRLLTRLTGSAEGGFAFREAVDVAVWERFLYVLDRQRHVIDVFKWERLAEGGF
ncbi:NHL repeat-containing protein [bacterium]|nr:NHL repeat-containing protein [bacterium]